MGPQQRSSESLSLTLGQRNEESHIPALLAAWPSGAVLVRAHARAVQLLARPGWKKWPPLPGSREQSSESRTGRSEALPPTSTCLRGFHTRSELD
ncbi:hypothetical protein MC885_004276 [Smutsia gigantea]|nr:hypothetical protein MC885_004276 [Smutsia gigantea]